MLPKLLKIICPIIDNETEILVVDGGSKDNTLKNIENFPVEVIHSKAGRAVQMNTGWKKSKGDVLYFLHSDTIPPITFMDDIQQALSEGYDSGCYRLGFDSNSLFLKINTYFTRYRKMFCRGGDQSLFVKRSIFEKLGGFPKGYLVMEEYPIIKALMTSHNYKIIPKYIVASARKYNNNNYLRVQFTHLVIFNMHRLGYSQEKMQKTYRAMLNN